MIIMLLPTTWPCCDALQRVIALSLYIHGPSSWFGGLSFPSCAWDVLTVSPTARRLPCSLSFPHRSQSNYDEQTLGSLGTTLTSKRTRDAAVEICGSSFFFLLLSGNGKRKVLIFQMLAVQIKIISICGCDWCLRIVFWHLIHMWDPCDL